ncbi:TPA: UDP-glucose 4-epimerase [bacterium]|nr:UDP-glucose 4-epimerase [bacterium]
MIRNVLVPGGAGYVGAVLVPKLLENGYNVKVVDLYIYGDVLNPHPNLVEIKGDVRDIALLEREIPGADAVIHLACISNDPSYELNPELSKSINYDAFIPFVEIAKKNEVKRFIFASSASVYGIKKEEEVTEDLSLEPLTDYSRYKAKCEEILMKEADDNFIVTIVRPATVCGYSPRLRLDLTVNILTNQAINKGEITVFGGEQMRPNIHIQDMTDLYLYLLKLPNKKINKKIYNAGWENYKVKEIAKIVQSMISNVSIKTVPSDDNRSYRVSSRKITDELGFTPKYGIKDAIFDLKNAFEGGKIPDSDDIKYYNIKTMQAINLK